MLHNIIFWIPWGFSFFFFLINRESQSLPNDITGSQSPAIYRGSSTSALGGDKAQVCCLPHWAAGT